MKARLSTNQKLNQIKKFGISQWLKVNKKVKILVGLK